MNGRPSSFEQRHPLWRVFMDRQSPAGAPRLGCQNRSRRSISHPRGASIQLYPTNTPTLNPKPSRNHLATQRAHKNSAIGCQH